MALKETLRGKAAIVGVGDTPVGRYPGRTQFAMHAEAALAAVADAGLTLADIDGVLTGHTMTQPEFLHHSVTLSEYLGIKPNYTAMMRLGGATHCAMIEHAAAAIAAGVCETVLCVSADPQLSGLSRDVAIATMAEVGHPQFEYPYGVHIPSLYALVAQRYAHDYADPTMAMAQLAVAQRSHAALNDNAFLRDPMSLDDYLASRMIADPLRLFDCAVICDGGAAVIVTSAERAKDLQRDPIYLLGAGEGHTHRHISQAESLTSFGCKESGPRALAMAGVTPGDIDVAEIYDCFTITVLVELEDIGFCGPGESVDFVGDGSRITLGGELPINTHGGLLSQGHPGVPGGMFHVVEGVRQLRGDCGARQVEDAELAFVHGNGIVLSTHVSLVLGTEATL